MNHPSGKSQAARADKNLLYQDSVQNPEWTVGFLAKLFKDKRRRKALHLREDFCGTAYLSAHWVASSRRRTAVGLDIDDKQLAWGEEQNRAPLGSAAKRLRLLCRDVLDGVQQPTDICVAFNFSYWCFRERPLMLRYFSRVRRQLGPDGVFVIDLFGGPEAQYQLEEPRKLKDYTYVWEQGMLDPINHRMQCRIHFRFADGSALQDAFVYDWRIWGLTELRDILIEAGFASVDTHWEDEDDEFHIAQEAENYEAYIAYLAAWV